MTNRYPKWWGLYVTSRALFYVIGVISLLFYGTVYTLASVYKPTATYNDNLVAIGCWVFLFLPFFVNYLIAKKRKRMIHYVLNEIKATGFFSPDKNSEAWLFWKNTYIGFDYRQGTIMYIRIYPGNVMDVIGFDAYSLVRTEVEGSKLRLYTKFASLPMIPIDTFSASSIADHLHGLNNKGYTYQFNFPDIVNKKRKELEALTGMPVAELV